jgi:hypothetical protein
MEKQPIFIKPHDQSVSEELRPLTLISTITDKYLVIVDKATTNIGCYVIEYIDRYGYTGEQVQQLMTLAHDWYNAREFVSISCKLDGKEEIEIQQEQPKIPFSIYLTKHGLQDLYSPLYYHIPMSNVTRIDGPFPIFLMMPEKRPKKRKRKELKIEEAITKVIYIERPINQ